MSFASEAELNCKKKSVYSRVDPQKLKQYLEVMNRIDKSGALDVYTVGALLRHPDANMSKVHSGHVLRDVLRDLPVVVIQPSLGGLLDHGFEEMSKYAQILRRPGGDIQSFVSLYQVLQESAQMQIFLQSERLRSLPMAELRVLAGSTQARKVLVGALEHVIGTKRLAKVDGIGRGTINRAKQAVEASQDKIADLIDQVNVSIFCAKIKLYQFVEM